MGGDGGVERRAAAPGRWAAARRSRPRARRSRPMFRTAPSGPRRLDADLVGRRDEHRVAGGLARAGARSAAPSTSAASRLAGEAERRPWRSTSTSLGIALGLPVLGAGGVARVARGVGVEHQRQQLGARRAVDRGVVDLGQDGEAVVGQALDDVGLPQRPAPVERAADDAGDELAELRRRCRAAPPPCGARGSRGRSRGPRSRTGGRGRTARRAAGAAAARAGGGAARSGPATRRAGRSRASSGRSKIERLETWPNCDGRLHVEEGGVETGELLHRCPPGPRCATTATLPPRAAPHTRSAGRGRRGRPGPSPGSSPSVRRRPAPRTGAGRQMRLAQYLLRSIRRVP